MRILLGSGGYRTDDRIANFRQRLVAHLGDVDQVLFIPYAHNDHDKYVQTMIDRGLHAGYDLVGIHRASNPRAAVADAQAIYVGGGNTFRLLNALYQHDLLDIIRERVRAGVPYLGVSAGSNVACPTIKTTNDMPIVQPPTFDALGLVPFQLNPHYYTGVNWVKHANPLTPGPSPGGRGEDFVEHFGETRDDRLREFHEMNDTPVIGLWEGGVLLCDGVSVQLHDAPARVFRKGQPAIDIEPVAELNRYLATDSRNLPSGPIPPRGDINVHDSLDEQSACKNFLGKTIDDAEKLFDDPASNPATYLEDMIHMGPRAFCYYVHAAINYARSPASSDNPDFIVSFAATLEHWTEHDPGSLKGEFQPLAEVCRNILENWERYNVDAEFYRGVKSQYVALEKFFRVLAGESAIIMPFSQFASTNHHRSV